MSNRFFVEACCLTACALMYFSYGFLPLIAGVIMVGLAEIVIAHLARNDFIGKLDQRRKRRR